MELEKLIKHITVIPDYLIIEHTLSDIFGEIFAVILDTED